MKTTPDATTPDNSAENLELVLERLQDPTYLPSYAELMSLGNCLDVGLRLAACGYPHKPNRFEIFTQEYVSGLVDLLATQRSGSEKDTLRVLEVGAGDGNLSYFLRAELNRRQKSGIDIICSDSGDLPIDSMIPDLVERIEAGQAVSLFKPDTVLSSWMSGHLDLTSAFRTIESVQSYVLIGPANDSFCGLAWETWGVGERPNKPAPYTRDGFSKEQIEVSENPQLNLTSARTNPIPSSTHIFRRQAVPA